jgi:hypothetical protein
MEEFKKTQLWFLLQLIGMSVLLFAVHSYFFHHFVKEVNLFFPLWQIYTFHLIVALAIYTIINYKFHKGKKDIFNLFLVMTLFKMVLAILFLLPLILSDVENKKPDVFNFFITYFVYLFFEVFAISKFLQKS